jgi:hypothetical protein
MKQCRFVQNTPFHLNKNASNSVNPKSVLNFLKINSITSLSNSNASPEFGRPFHFGHWF